MIETEIGREAIVASMQDRYQRVRNHSLRICESLAPEDCVVQSMPDVSPMRWHLAHTSWFFETFVLKEFGRHADIDSRFEYLFNSYYNTVGDQFPRHRRGLLSRPTLSEILAYRREVDRRLSDLFSRATDCSDRLLRIVELGLHHEQQHQELMLTDIKHVFSCNPLYPAFQDGQLKTASETPCHWTDFEEGVRRIGHDGDAFSFDNEGPSHRVFAEPFQLSRRLVTNGEYAEFVSAGGYQQPEHWLSLGWAKVRENGWTEPLYWIDRDDESFEFTLAGLVKRDQAMPVTHLSFFEADAYARWAGARLATELEWEIAAGTQESAEEQQLGAEDFFERDDPVHPGHGSRGETLDSLFGSVWQWTSSSYSPYPGYAPPAGAIGEYNGKFMCNQYVLRGSSCATSRGHSRLTYRNFFPPEARWQFTGIRLARSL